MSCTFDKEKLSAFYDGELAAGEKAEVERHIASCSECLRDLGELRSAALLIKELPRLRAPKSVAAGVSREIQAAGKVHVLARFRRTVLWASAAAAGLFVVVNAMYLTNARKEPAPVAARSMAPTIAQVAPAESPEPARPKSTYGDAARDALTQNEVDRAPALRREQESLKEAGEKRIEGKLLDDRKADLAKAEKAAPAPVTAPMPEPKPASPPPAPSAKAAAEAPAERVARKEVEEAAKPGAELKSKAAAAAAPVDLAPLQYSCVTTAPVAKLRPRIEESLKKMNLSALPPAAQPTKQPRSREAENTLVVELTDAQLLKLREELEKPGDARLVAFDGNTVEPVLGGFKTGGIYGAKKDAASGGKPAGPVPSAKDKDAKESEKNDATAPEARRRVTLHLVEQKSLPPLDAEVPAKKN